MNGATEKEMAEFRRIKAAERAAVTQDDAKAVRQMAWDWIKSAKSVAAKQRRMRMSNAIKFAHSCFASDTSHRVVR